MTDSLLTWQPSPHCLLQMTRPRCTRSSLSSGHWRRSWRWQSVGGSRSRGQQRGGGGRRTGRIRRWHAEACWNRCRSGEEPRVMWRYSCLSPNQGVTASHRIIGSSFEPPQPVPSSSAAQSSGPGRRGQPSWRRTRCSCRNCWVQHKQRARKVHAGNKGRAGGWVRAPAAKLGDGICSRRLPLLD